MKRGLYISIILLLATTGFAQRTNWQKALSCYQQDSLVCAAEYIDASIEDSSESKDAYAWHIRGFVYKSIFDNSKNPDKRSSARAIAIESFDKSLELDTIGDLSRNNKQGIKTLGVSFYNDGVRKLNRFNVQGALQDLDKHNITMRLVEPGYYNKEREFAIKKTSGIIYMDRYNDNKEENEIYFKKATEMFNEVLEIDSNDFLANLNSGVLYHNLAVDLLVKTKPELSILEVMELQEKHVNNMQRSLAYMTKAYTLKPNHPGVIRALAGAYYALHETEKYEFYNQKLLKLEGSHGNE